ncbi:hypothetical protein DFP72DRAFT_843272, partial [Ephemerocybe angulata]
MGQQNSSIVSDDAPEKRRVTRNVERYDHDTKESVQRQFILTGNALAWRKVERVPRLANPILPDIVFERTDSIEGDGPSLNLVGLCVFETTGSRAVQSFALVNYSPGRWKVDTFIELTAETDAIVCVVQSDVGEDIGFLYLDRKAMGSTQAHSAHEFSQEVEICDEQMGLTMRWKGIGILPDRFQVDDDVATQSNEYGVDRLRAFERTGELSALTDAISYLQQGVELTPR